ncbi:MAG: glycosyltransferase family protein [Ilumatobacteraceae bacterium]
MHLKKGRESQAPHQVRLRRSRTQRHPRGIRAIAQSDPRIKLLGGVWDQTLLDQLYANAHLYLHGHSIGGTNPSLLRAAGAGAAVAAFDVRFNREVLGDEATYFNDEQSVVAAVEKAEADPDHMGSVGASLQERIAEHYDWDRVADQYEALAHSLARGGTRRGEVSGRRNGVW